MSLSYKKAREKKKDQDREEPEGIHMGFFAFIKQLSMPVHWLKIFLQSGADIYERQFSKIIGYGWIPRFSQAFSTKGTSRPEA